MTGYKDSLLDCCDATACRGTAPLFEDVEAGSPQEAARTATRWHGGMASVEECGGETFGAAADRNGETPWRGSVRADLAPQRLLDAAPSLRSLRSAVEAHGGGGSVPPERVAEARAAIALAEEPGPEAPAPATSHEAVR